MAEAETSVFGVSNARPSFLLLLQPSKHTYVTSSRPAFDHSRDYTRRRDASRLGHEFRAESIPRRRCTSGNGGPPVSRQTSNLPARFTAANLHDPIRNRSTVEIEQNDYGRKGWKGVGRSGQEEGARSDRVARGWPSIFTADNASIVDGGGLGGSV